METSANMCLAFSALSTSASPTKQNPKFTLPSSSQKPCNHYHRRHHPLESSSSRRRQPSISSRNLVFKLSLGEFPSSSSQDLAVLLEVEGRAKSLLRSGSSTWAWVMIWAKRLDPRSGEGAAAALPTNDGHLYDDLKVPSSAFLSSLRTAIDEVGRVTSIISKFIDVFGDFRLSNAVNDCMDLLDFSSDELSMTASATQNPTAKDNSTGNRRSDLRTWLSAALGNQDTCMDGFDGTNSFIKNIVGGGIGQVTSLVGELLQMVNQSWADAVVALDGSGNYSSVGDAVKAVPDSSTKRFVIYVKRGVYKENVEIKKKKWNIMLVGDGMNSTIITGNRNFVDAVAGQGFIARDITFENTAGPEKHQAVALRCDSDLSAFYKCGIRGYQDTLYAHSLRQFYRECVITGTVDFIFGNGAVVIQNCQIIARKPLPQQKNSITAQGRKDPNQNTGFSIQFCNITGDSDLLALPNSTATYLGRPWKEYSKTVIMQSYMSNVIRSEGWLEWQGNFALDTLFYGEYMNYGPGQVLVTELNGLDFMHLTVLVKPLTSQCLSS
ncbi:hypothetical protein Syun_011513 [Stephania yunnanensis]|uniref:Pectinesterase n=1 Tax=Stephania yunnanensis TaxID=152371 RepID=A0AAP0JYW6_9MAGN